MNSHKRLSYAAIASALAVNKPMVGDHNSYAYYIWMTTVHALVDVLANGNVRFNRKRFLLAAGVL